MLFFHVCRFMKSAFKPNIGLINNNVPQVFKAFSSSLSQFQRRNMSSNLLSDKPEDRIIWIDLEMSGLDIEKHRILEVACLITDSNLNVIAEGPELVLHQPQQVLDLMNEWCVNQHTKSGLIKKVLDSNITENEAEQQLLDFVKLHTPEKKCPLGGNSVSFDRYFMLKHFPRFEQHLHYRMIDVSSVKELCRRWFPDEYEKVTEGKGDSKHRALDDIRKSIVELKYYRKTIFRPHEGVESMAIAWC